MKNILVLLLSASFLLASSKSSKIADTQTINKQRVAKRDVLAANVYKEEVKRSTHVEERSQQADKREEISKDRILLRYSI